MKPIVLVAALWLITLTTIAQSGATSALQTAVNRLDNAWTLNQYSMLSTEFTRLANTSRTNWLPYYYAAYCTVRMAYLSQDNPEKMEFYSDRAEALIKKAQQLSPVNDRKMQSELACVWSMVNRSRVIASPMRNGFKYGRPANEFCAKAQQLAPDNPRALYLAAYEKYYAPAVFGGDKAQAKQLLNQALTKYSQPDGTTTAPHWGKADCEALAKQF